MLSTGLSTRRLTTERARTGLRRAAGIAGATVLACAAVVPSAHAAPAPAVPAGLYGAQDPTYDGVYRQSLSLLALRGAGVTPSPSAVAWLLAQQCVDGGFPSFRSASTTSCAPAQEDSNATAVAVQALVALGQGTQASRGAAWVLAHLSSKDGGIGYNPGNASDANSTGLALSALAAAGVTPPASPSPQDLLRSLQLGCSAPEASRGGLDYQVQKTPVANDSATTQALFGLSGGVLPLAASIPTADAPALPCPAGATDAASSQAAAAGYLALRLTANGGALPSAFGSGSDLGTTADAALALAASGRGGDALALTATRLAAVAPVWPKDAKGTDRPAALAKLALVAQATGGNPRSFGGTDLVTRLERTLTPLVTPTVPPKPTAKPTVKPTPKPTNIPPTRPTAAPAPRPASSTPAAAPGGGTTGGAGGTTGATGLGGSLPRTGGSPQAPLAVGAGLLLSGGGLLALSRRRTTTSS